MSLRFFFPFPFPSLFPPCSVKSTLTRFPLFNTTPPASTKPTRLVSEVARADSFYKIKPAKTRFFEIHPPEWVSGRSFENGVSHKNSRRSTLEFRLVFPKRKGRKVYIYREKSRNFSMYFPAGKERRFSFHFFFSFFLLSNFCENWNFSSMFHDVKGQSAAI